MKRLLWLRCSVLAVLLPAAGFAQEGWSQLKTGMTRDETHAVLGAELMASRGRGFEVAIYDRGAEVLFLNGQVVAWTAPGAVEAPAAPAAAWQFDQVARPRIRVTSPTEAPGANVRQRATLPAYRW